MPQSAAAEILPPEEEGHPAMGNTTDADQPQFSVIASSAHAHALMEKEKIIQQLESIAKQVMVLRYEFGEGLHRLKRMCEPGEFAGILSDRLGGMTVQAANRNIVFYQKCDQHPRLRHFADENFSKAMVMFNGLETEELQLIEDGRHELKINDVDSMSVQQLKREIKRLRADLSESVAEATKELSHERDMLIDERDRLEGQLAATTGRTPDAEWFLEQTVALEKLVVSVGYLTSTLINKGLDNCTPDAVTRIQAQLAAAHTLATRAMDEFNGAAEEAGL